MVVGDSAEKNKKEPKICNNSSALTSNHDGRRNTTFVLHIAAPEGERGLRRVRGAATLILLLSTSFLFHQNWLRSGLRAEIRVGEPSLQNAEANLEAKRLRQRSTVRTRRRHLSAGCIGGNTDSGSPKQDQETQNQINTSSSESYYDTSDSSEEEVWLVTTFAGHENGTRGLRDGSLSNAMFNFPETIDYDKTTDTIYVGDTANFNIRMISPDQKVNSMLKRSYTAHFNPGTEVIIPYGIAVSGEENCIYIADVSNHNIVKIHGDEGVCQYAGSSKPGLRNGYRKDSMFEYPRFLDLDPNGNLVVGDAVFGDIRKITPYGQVLHIRKEPRPSPLGYPGIKHIGGLAVHRNGDIYVSCREVDHRILRVLPNGTYERFAGSFHPGFRDGSSSSALFFKPHGLVFDDEDNLWVADRLNCAVRKITPQGEVTTVAGIGLWGYQDGLAKIAVFSEVMDLTIDQYGNVYVLDTDSSVIRKISRIPRSEAHKHLAKITPPPSTIPTRAPAVTNFTLLETPEERKARLQIERLTDNLIIPAKKIAEKLFSRDATASPSSLASAPPSPSPNMFDIPLPSTLDNGDEEGGVLEFDWTRGGEVSVSGVRDIPKDTVKGDDDDELMRNLSREATEKLPTEVVKMVLEDRDDGTAYETIQNIAQGDGSVDDKQTDRNLDSEMENQWNPNEEFEPENLHEKTERRQKAKTKRNKNKVYRDLTQGHRLSPRERLRRYRMAKERGIKLGDEEENLFGDMDFEPQIPSIDLANQLLSRPPKPARLNSNNISMVSPRSRKCAIMRKVLPLDEVCTCGGLWCMTPREIRFKHAPPNSTILTPPPTSVPWKEDKTDIGSSEDHEKALVGVKPKSFDKPCVQDLNCTYTSDSEEFQRRLADGPKWREEFSLRRFEKYLRSETDDDLRFRGAWMRADRELPIIEGEPRDINIVGYDGYFQFGADRDISQAARPNNSNTLSTPQDTKPIAVPPVGGSRQKYNLTIAMVPYRTPPQQRGQSRLAPEIQSKIDETIGWEVSISDDDKPCQSSEDDNIDGRRGLYECASPYDPSTKAKQGPRSGNATVSLRDLEMLEIRRQKEYIENPGTFELDPESPDSEDEKFNFHEWISVLGDEEREMMLEYLQGEKPDIEDLLMISKEEFFEEVGQSAISQMLYRSIRQATEPIRQQRKRRKIRRQRAKNNARTLLIGRRVQTI